MGRYWYYLVLTFLFVTNCYSGTAKSDTVWAKEYLKAGLVKSDSATIPILTDNVVTRGTHTAAAFIGPLTGNVTGKCTGYANSTGAANGNVGNGYLVLNSLTSGHDNIASGNQVMYSTTTGHSNVASGWNALYANTSGYQNVVSGMAAGIANTTGYDNVAIGYATLHSNTSGSHNVAIGWNANYNGNYSNTTCIGSDAQANGSNQLVFRISQIPTSATGLPSGAVYRGAGNALYIVP